MGTRLSDRGRDRQSAEVYYGYDLTGRKLEGDLLDGGERTQHLLFGVADMANFLAIGISTAFKVLGLQGCGIVDPSCFAAGTPLLTPDGSKPIEECAPAT